MKTSVSFCSFCDAFRTMDRNDQFSYDAKRALFDYLEDLEYQMGTEFELDVIALCCEYAESSIENIINDYSIDVSEADMALDDEDKAYMVKEIVMDYLNNNTMVVAELDNGDVVYQQF